MDGRIAIADGTDIPDSSPAVAQLGMGTGAAGLTWFESTRFAAEFRRGLFIALSTGASGMSGDAEAITPASVQFLSVHADGRVELREFAAGFLRPIDVATGGSAVYVADAGSGVIYRIGAPFED
jgi:glucose/arabinose dehydrogenase